MLAMIASQDNSEGCVIYGLDATGACHYVGKVKSVAYVLERKLRESTTRGNSELELR